MFSDEKKFDLDGPDGLACYWIDVRGKLQRLYPKQQGSRSVMFWGAISSYGFSELVVVEENQNSEKKWSILQNHLRSWIAGLFGEQWACNVQQDNMHIQRPLYTTKWLRQQAVRTLSWPFRSPEMNILESAWALMARRVYSNGKQFENTQDLEKNFRTLWESFLLRIPRKVVWKHTTSSVSCHGQERRHTQVINLS